MEKEKDTRDMIIFSKLCFFAGMHLNLKQKSRMNDVISHFINPEGRTKRTKTAVYKSVTCSYLKSLDRT